VFPNVALSNCNIPFIEGQRKGDEKRKRRRRSGALSISIFYTSIKGDTSQKGNPGAQSVILKHP